MPLRQCPDCARDVSTDARTCPTCGKPLDTLAGIFGALGRFIIFACIVGITMRMCVR